MLTAKKVASFSGPGLEKLFKDIFNTVREPLLVLNRGLYIVTANNSFYKAFKTTPGKVKGVFLYNVGNEEWDMPALRGLLEKVIKTGRPFNDFEVTRNFPGVGPKTMLLNARLVEDRRNGMSLVLLAIEDVTALKKHQEQLIESGKLAAVGQLSAGIAHGLNSPLTGLVNFLKAYKKIDHNDRVRYKELCLMLNGCKYMSEIIQNLTYFARDLKKNESVIDLNEVVKDTLIFSERQFLVKNIKVVKKLVGRPDKIKARKSDLQQMFLNVILNSKDAMERGGRLMIRTRNEKRRKMVKLEIIDDGRGIPDGVMSRIFEPFFTTKEDKKGTGLGLTVAYGIVRENKGTIEVQSRAKKGTKVSISFPSYAKKEKEMQ